ncbi:hypothetical protein C8J57DRAFT_1466399 [Mycena rebaudengoi]|nr:hypothetical protein C8J57DRAFT_1466399 [Mycena rebaudengoi]
MAAAAWGNFPEKVDHGGLMSTAYRGNVMNLGRVTISSGKILASRVFMWAMVRLSFSFSFVLQSRALSAVTGRLKLVSQFFVEFWSESSNVEYWPRASQPGSGQGASDSGKHRQAIMVLLGFGLSLPIGMGW